MLFEGRENRRPQRSGQIVRNQPHLIFARVVWSSGLVNFCFIDQRTSLFVIQALDASIERKVSKTLPKTSDSVENVFNADGQHKRQNSISGCARWRMSLWVRKAVLSPHITSLAVHRCSHSSTGFKVQRRRLFANEIQTGLKPGHFWPFPFLLRQCSLLIITVVNWALHEDRFPSIHVNSVPFVSNASRLARTGQLIRRGVK